MPTFDIAVRNPRVYVGILDIEHFCVDVDATNTGQVEAFPTGMWSAVRPSGVVIEEYPASTELTFIFPVVVPGAVSSATRCFMTEGERGTYVVRVPSGNGDLLTWTFVVP